MASERQAEGISSPDTELWRSIGPVTELSKKSCRLLYSSLGYESDLCLFHVQGEFFSMDTRCAHAGGPLCEGDIEEVDGVLKVFCPWHDYDFDIRTGESQTGLQPLLNLSHVGCFEGGPLCEGDIEEVDGVLKVFCPWHDYDFDIRTGESQTGLQSQSEDQGRKQDVALCGKIFLGSSVKPEHLLHKRYQALKVEPLSLCLNPGGPLCEGDIEEVEGVLKVFCPWHDYDFDIRTGESQTGLQSQSEDQGRKQDSYCSYSRFYYELD
ncbi:UNVERIFIED_CONTAM: hypothetical protein FKN15_016705 [Acipenser sinensis]